MHLWLAWDIQPSWLSLHNAQIRGLHHHAISEILFKDIYKAHHVPLLSLLCSPRQKASPTPPCDPSPGNISIKGGKRSDMI